MGPREFRPLNMLADLLEKKANGNIATSTTTNINYSSVGSAAALDEAKRIRLEIEDTKAMQQALRKRMLSSMKEEGQQEDGMMEE